MQHQLLLSLLRISWFYIFGHTTSLEWLSQRISFLIKLRSSAQPRSRSEAPPARHWFPCLGNSSNPHCTSLHAWDPQGGIQWFINHSLSTSAECLRASPKSHVLQMGQAKEAIRFLLTLGICSLRNHHFFDA